MEINVKEYQPSMLRKTAVVLLLSLTAASMAYSAVLLERQGTIGEDNKGYTEYLGFTGLVTQRNAPFRLVVPDEWNGILMVYARGTGSATLLGVDGNTIFPADKDGKLAPEVELLGQTLLQPVVGVTPLTNVPGLPQGDNTDTLALEERLLEVGYALVASDYRYDPQFIEKGLLTWVVEDGIRDTLAVETQAKLILLSRHGGSPDGVYLWGRSQGSLVALNLVENKPWRYDGSAVGCTVGAGTTRTWDWGLGFALAFDTVFHDVCNDNGCGWESLGAGSVEGGDIPPDLSFSNTVLPNLFPLLLDPQNRPRFEFIRLVNQLPFKGFYPTGEDPLADAFAWVFTSSLFLTEVRGDLESARKADGQVSQNRDHSYDLSQEQIGYLRNLKKDVGFGLKPKQTFDFLATMNDSRFDADTSARAYAEQYYEPTGDLRRPVISMHTQVDGLVIPASQSALRELTDMAGQSENLVQVYTNEADKYVGHCRFSVDQWHWAVENLVDWRESLDAPDAGSFPDGDPNYEPEPWPQPLF
jgi:hypothetical protein